MKGAVVTVIAVCAALGGTASRGAASDDPPVRLPQISYRLDVSTASRLCVGRKLTMTAAVVRHDAPANAQPLVGGILSQQGDVPISATVADPAVLGPAKVLEITGWGNVAPPADAKFTFKANKPGTTSITFKASIAGMRDSGWPGVLADRNVDREVRVRDCWFKVSLASTWQVPGPAGIAVSGGMFEVPMTRTPSGTYEGSGDMKWGAVTASVGTCSGTLTIGTSKVALTGTIDDEGIVTVKAHYDSAPLAIAGTCTNLTSTATPSSLLIEGSANSVIRGTVPQSLTAGGQLNAGEAEFSIQPMDTDAG